MRFSLEHLEAFVTAVDVGSFSGAARKLGKVQSQVSVAIATLEDDLGIKLFDRGGKYPVITNDGEELLYKSRQLLQSSENITEHADRIALGEQTVLHIALDEFVPVRVAAQVFSMFGRAWPNIELEVLWGAMGDVQKIVGCGRADVGVEMPVNNISMSSLSFKEMAHADFCGVVSANHPLAKQSEVTKDTLRSHRQAMGMSQLGTRLPDAFRLGDQVWLCEDSRLMRHLVLAGDVWAAMPRYFVAKDLASGDLVELPVILGECQVESRFYYVWAPTHELTSAESWLADVFGGKLREVCRAT